MEPTVFACIDNSNYAGAVCDYASWSAQRLNAPLALVHVLDEPDGSAYSDLSGSIGFDAQESLLMELTELDAKRAKVALEQGKLMLAAAKERVMNAGIASVEVRQRHGDLISTLQEFETETRMLVVGKCGVETASAHGHIGGHVERIIRALHVPILIAQQSFAPPKTVMIAFDGSPTTFKGVEMIAASKLFHGLPCHLVTVGKNNEVVREQLRTAQQILTNAGFSTHSEMISGDPELALVDYQEQANIDLMVMGAYGHSRIRHFMIGSTTTTMIAKTKISLMVLR